MGVRTTRESITQHLSDGENGILSPLIIPAEDDSIYLLAEARTYAIERPLDTAFLVLARLASSKSLMGRRVRF